jgi:hypothetical protein
MAGWGQRGDKMSFYKSWRLLAVLAAVLIAGTGCSHSYVDPSYGKIGYGDLAQRQDKLKWRVSAEFQRNGIHRETVDATLATNVDRVLRGTAMVVPTSDPASPELKVVVNNFGDIGAAAGKGFVTGLTFGIAGNTVTDFYEMHVTLTDGDKIIRKSGYKHELHTTVGNAKGPAGVSPTSATEGFQKIMEQMLLNALKDIEGDLALQTSRPGPIS